MLDSKVSVCPLVKKLDSKVKVPNFKQDPEKCALNVIFVYL